MKWSAALCLGGHAVLSVARVPKDDNDDADGANT